MRLPSPIPALLSLVLLGASGQVLATDSRTMDAGASGPENTSAGNARIDDAETDPNAPATPATRNAKAAAAPRSSGANRSSAPRWHSFLPGMFR